MNTNSLLYLRLGIAHNEEYLNAQLQENGFRLLKKTGGELESFRNYYYEMSGAPDAIELSMKFMPGKRITQTISVTIAPDLHPKHAKRFFDHLNHLVKRVPFHLLDLQRRNKIYEQLHQEGKVDAFYVGLNEEEQLEVEQQAYIPLDDKAFLASRKTIVRNEDGAGERAPDLDV